MSQARIARGLVVAATGAALLAMAACTTAPPTTSASTSASASDECAAYKVYGDLAGKTISVFTSIASDSEARPHTDSYKPFETCTGAKIKY